MPDNSTILSLPLILPAQAQKHVTHNEALRILDVAVQAAVSDRTQVAPPVGPAQGQRPIIAAGATGDWAVQSGTSLAAPVVSAAVACLRALTPTTTFGQIKQQLIQQARDLGEPGKDKQFGFGLMAAPLKTQL